MRRLLLRVGAIALLVVVALAATAAVLLQPDRLKARITAKLSERLNLDTTIDDVSLTLLPRPRVSGRGIALRIRQRPDLPPFITIDHVEVNIGLLSAYRKHVDTLHVGGLKIVVPPSDVRRGMSASAGSFGNSTSQVIIDHLVTHDAELVFVPRKPGKKPLRIAIHDLSIDDVGFDRAMTYRARLTNPVPVGTIDATGVVGPWQRDYAPFTPVSGSYVFSDADLSTINGIGGTLTSTGTFDGQLTAINVTGEASIPDFNLDLGGKPVPLTAKFLTIVDGTDGTTVLKRVDATVLHTQMLVSGAITNLEGPGRHDVSLDVTIEDGRIEDLLAMGITAPQPVMIGGVTLTARLLLPPGPSRVRNRISLAGRFGLDQSRFTDRQVRSRLTELSRRSQGLGKDDPPGPVVASDVAGRFELARGQLSLSNLTFQVPGATIALIGSYDLGTEVMDFHGTLRMQASASEAIGGFKSLFVKPFDFLFRKDGAGAVVPIKITGTRQTPKYGVEVGKIFGRQ